MACFVVASVLFVGNRAIDDIVETELKGRGNNFVHLLKTQRGAIDVLMTGLSREPGVEATIRKVANLSGIDRFSVFDATGNEVYTSRSDRYDWLMRDRPGGISAGDSLSAQVLARKGEDWRIVQNGGSTSPSVIQPLYRDGQRIGFVSVVADVAVDRIGYTTTLIRASSVTALVLLFATGGPFLLYLHRRKNIAEADARIEFLANYDNLTQLYNRPRMQEETDKLLTTARATRERLAYLFIDLDEISEINDRLGQANGDEMLQVLAKRITMVCAKDDLTARVGPDDFAIVRRRIISTDDVKAFARRLTNTLCEPIMLAGEAIRPRISIGCAMAPIDGRNHTDLVKHAELAHLRHKSSKQDDLVFFESWMDEETHRRREIEAIVRHAVENDGFELFYQPLVCGASHRLLGFEALLRLRDNGGAYISPAEFVPVAEARGYIKRIGTWVIQEAVCQIAQWPEHLFVSVNLSAVQFADRDLFDIVVDALEGAGVTGERLELEVVESLVLDRSEDILEQLKQLKSLGVSVAMDDFGTGYSSLSYLWRFPFDKLKIDQSFMFALARGERNVAQLVETIVAMGHHMSMKVTAEGVETQEQVDLLEQFGCDILQGYFFGKPMAVADIAAGVLTQFRDNETGTPASAHPEMAVVRNS